MTGNFRFFPLYFAKFHQPLLSVLKIGQFNLIQVHLKQMTVCQFQMFSY